MRKNERDARERVTTRRSVASTPSYAIKVNHLNIKEKKKYEGMTSVAASDDGCSVWHSVISRTFSFFLLNISFVLSSFYSFAFYLSFHRFSRYLSLSVSRSVSVACSSLATYSSEGLEDDERAPSISTKYFSLFFFIRVYTYVYFYIIHHYSRVGAAGAAPSVHYPALVAQATYS